MNITSTGTAVAVLCVLALAGGAAARVAEPNAKPSNAVVSAPDTDAESCKPPATPPLRNHIHPRGIPARGVTALPSTRVWVEVMLSVTYTASAAGPACGRSSCRATARRLPRAMGGWRGSRLPMLPGSECFSREPYPSDYHPFHAGA